MHELLFIHAQQRDDVNEQIHKLPLRWRSQRSKLEKHLVPTTHSQGGDGRHEARHLLEQCFEGRLWGRQAAFMTSGSFAPFCTCKHPEDGVEEMLHHVTFVGSGKYFAVWSAISQITLLLFRAP
jgi:hypothetical protein